MSVSYAECAILSMDCYNRNYIPASGDSSTGIEPLDLSLDSLLDQPVSKAGELAVPDSSFYAFAYNVDGTIVIAFRGTDADLDQTTGWGVGTGSVSEQALLAAEFVRSVQASNPGTEIILTGHSLGGALAGFCATVFDLEAYAFDPASFQDAAQRARADAVLDEFLVHGGLEAPVGGNTDLDYTAIRDRVYGEGPGAVPALMSSAQQQEKIHVTVLEGEILNAARWLGGGIGNAEYQALEMPGITNIPPEGVPTAFHMQELLVIRQSVEDAHLSDWLTAGGFVIEQLWNSDLAQQIGVAARGDTPAARVMTEQIAYSVGGGTAYGNTAAISLNHDTATIGHVMSLSTSGEVTDLSDAQLSAFATTAVEFSSLLAQHAVMDGPTGLVSYDDATSLISFDFTEATWSSFNPDPDRPQVNSVGLDALLVEAHASVGLPAEAKFFFEQSNIGSVSFLVGADDQATGVAYTPQVHDLTATGETQAAVVVGTGGNDTLTTAQDDDADAIYFAGAGDDTIVGYGRAAFGGDGNDTISFVWTAVGGNGDDVFSAAALAAGGDGNDEFSNCTFMWGGAGADTFNIDTSIYNGIIIVNDPDLTLSDFINGDSWSAGVPFWHGNQCVIFNPDQDDLLYINDELMGNLDITTVETETYFIDNDQFLEETYGIHTAGRNWAGGLDGEGLLYMSGWSDDLGFAPPTNPSSVFDIVGLRSGDFGIQISAQDSPLQRTYFGSSQYFDVGELFSGDSANVTDLVLDMHVATPSEYWW